MKKLLFAAALFCTFNVQAQEMKLKSPQERAERQSKMMEKKLNLNETQATQIRKINTETAVQMEAPIARTREDRSQIKTLHATRMEEYRRVLTPDQFKSYEAFEAERRDHMKARTSGARRSGNINKGNLDQPQMMQSQPAEVR